MRVPDELREDLVAQLTSRVRWTESVQLLHRQGIQTCIELGSGSVLAGLIKRIEPSMMGQPAGAPGDFDALEV
jgi:[acyl-carrier-protein] S-malonyltransferase